jgi:hypothetical protein
VGSDFIFSGFADVVVGETPKSIGGRLARVREWAGDGAQFIELDGARALDEFYVERGLVP